MLKLIDEGCKDIVQYLQRGKGVKDYEKLGNAGSAGAMAAFLMLCAGCGQNSNGADSAAAETEQEQQQEPVVEQVEDVDMTLSFSVYEGDATTKETYEKEGKYTGQLVDGKTGWRRKVHNGEFFWYRMVL